MRPLLLFLSLVLVVPSLTYSQGAAKAPKAAPVATQAVEPQAISGLASSGRNCVGPSGANVHAIGWVPSNSRVTITFSSDFDPVASVTNTQLGADVPGGVARTAYWSDDDGGGNLEPLINFTTTYSGTLVLHVSKFSPERAAGCYFYKVEIITG